MRREARLAVVTGASAGLGAAFARELARRGYDLVLVARRGDRLDALARALRAETARGLDGGPAVACVAADLATAEGHDALWRAVDARGIAPDVLVNNAGLGYVGRATDADGARVDAMLAVNAGAVTRASLEAARRMARSPRGGAVVNVASTAAFQASPYMAVYAATKAYVLSFSEALDEELRRAHGARVRALAVCPGYMPTEFQGVAGLDVAPPPRPFVASPQACARRAIDAVEAGARGSRVDGSANAALQAALRALPRRAVAWFGARVMAPR